MRNKKLKILLKKVGQEPEVKFIDNTLLDKQKLVGGLIEVLDFEDDTLLICNENGKNINLLPNTIFDMDYIAGDYFVVGNDFENADFKSITDEQIKKVTPIIKSKSPKYTEKFLKKFSQVGPFYASYSIMNFIEDYENDFLTKLDDESNEHIAEDYKEDFEL